MSFNRMLGFSFVISLVLWTWFSWPLPRYLASGIPAAAHREAADVQRMVPGDHLQFMYYCWLAGDMAIGRTPLFYNLYEFNTGNDRERYEPDAYYIPFSLIYAAGAGLGGRACGWNLAGFISLWFTYLLTWLLVRRWTREACPATTGEWIAAVTALLGIALPMRWINLFGGSPAGFAMIWIPAILLGIDLAVREDRVGGGILAGAAILMASWSDQHVFFFGVLAAPAWGLAVFAARPDFQWRQIAAYRRLALALVPIGIFAVVALLFPSWMKGLYHSVTGLTPVAHATGPRDPTEVLRYSPDRGGFFGTNTIGISAHIYLGVILIASLAAGWLALLVSTVKHSFLGQGNFPKDKIVAGVAAPAPSGVNPGLVPLQAGPRSIPTSQRVGTATEKVSPSAPNPMITGGLGETALPKDQFTQISFRPLIVLSFIGVVILGIMILALGGRGPWHGALMEFVRNFIPPYAMIRQPAKIFCLMPSLLAVASALALMALVQLRAGRIWRILLPLVLVGLVLLDYSRRTNPTISLMEKKQDAYAAVADDAAAGRVNPRALVLPLWPGDSHYASIYQYFASLYHVRMVNGYNPFIKRGYFENVFRRFESVNQGGLSGEQIAGLLQMNVRYILLHENMFPEKVSPFPVTATLKKLLGHPRLELLGQDGSVWAFKILDERRASPSKAPAWEPLFPTRRFEMEKTSAERRVTVKMSSDTGGRAYVALEESGANLKTEPTRVDAVSNLHWLVRARGRGVLNAETTVDQDATALFPIPIQSREWVWFNLPVPVFRGFALVSLKLELGLGTVDLDLGLLTAGPWPQLRPGESVTLPAPIFFHGGHIDLKSDSVVFRRDHDPQGVILYGPKLPLPEGTYAVEIAFSSPAADGVELAKVNLEQQDARGENLSERMLTLRAGQPARGQWQQYANLPSYLVVDYLANADVTIRQITLTRVK